MRRETHENALSLALLSLNTKKLDQPRHTACEFVVIASLYLNLQLVVNSDFSHGGGFHITPGMLMRRNLRKLASPPTGEFFKIVYRRLFLYTENQTIMTEEKRKGAKQGTAILKWANEKGEFHRADNFFKNKVTVDGSSGFPAESGRYHLYVSYACPWAQRTLITRKLKGLEGAISVDVVDYHLGEKGWRFDPNVPGATADTVNGATYLREVYFMAKEDYQGRFTVPTLWDKVQKTVVNNNSADIIRMLNSEFNEFCKTPEQQALDLYPEHLREEIDSLNEWIYR